MKSNGPCGEVKERPRARLAGLKVGRTLMVRHSYSLQSVVYSRQIKARARPGPPEPPAILSGRKTNVAPRGGSSLRLHRASI